LEPSAKSLFEPFVALVHPCRVRFLRVLVAWLLLAVWPVAASHTWLEGLGAIHGAESDEPTSHCAGEHQHCGNHELADGGCRLENPEVTVPALTTASWAALVAQIFLVVPKAADALRPDPSPPDLRVSWVFYSRAALPPRAPSLAS